MKYEAKIEWMRVLSKLPVNLGRAVKGGSLSEDKGR